MLKPAAWAALVTLPVRRRPPVKVRASTAALNGEGARNSVDRAPAKLLRGARRTVLEVIAASVAATFGAAITVIAAGSTERDKRNKQAQDAVIRLTEAVEHIANQLGVLHEDIKADRREMYGRINNVEQRVSRLEVK